jgi:HK97 gp10 family phage protein
MVRMVKIVDTAVIANRIEKSIAEAVNEVAEHAHDRALRDVPSRKIFRYGRAPRTGDRQQARQETRTLSVAEAASEAAIRRRLGLPSAFPTDSSGRRTRGSSPQVQTALFPGNYRTRDRANNYRSMDRRQFATIKGENRLVILEEREFRGKARGEKVSRTYRVPVPNAEAESDLDARGRYELKKGRAIAERKGEGQTLGGALRRTVEDGLTPATPGGKLIKATIEAGSGEVDYAKYVEFGTRRSRAQPFLRPALAQAREELRDAVVDALVQGLGGKAVK